MYIVEDNFLTESQAYRIDNFMLSPNFPWHLGKVLSDLESSEVTCDEIDNYQFSHLFYRENKYTGSHHQLLEPFLTKLGVEALVKIKANLNPRTSKVVEHGYHRDFQFDCLTAVYYINTNDGYTKFKDGDKVDSVSGRMLIFKSSQWHTGTTCTNQKMRGVINFNFFSSKYQNLLTT